MNRQKTNRKKMSSYIIPKPDKNIDMFLDGNEGTPPDLSQNFIELSNDRNILSRYPNTEQLQSLLSKDIGVAKENLIVTAGGDEAIDRICRTTLGPRKKAIVPVPTFSMFYHYIPLSGGEMIKIDWTTEQFPLKQIIDKIDESVSLITVVSPNNPTGFTVTKEELSTLAASAPHQIILVDLAYAEYASEDLTQTALQYENCVVVRSLSKAWGLAGLRIGYAIGSADVIASLKSAGGPYAVSSLSSKIAYEIVKNRKNEMKKNVRQTIQNRDKIKNTLEKFDKNVLPSQANFLLLKDKKAAWIKEALAGFGIAVRSFDYEPWLSDAIRITIPTNRKVEKLNHALKSILEPEAILFDMDGVLADVSNSFRRTIIETASKFGVSVSLEEISEYKQKGNANNDWLLTQNLLKSKGKNIAFEQLKNRFEMIYQGTNEIPGLKQTEQLIPKIENLENLSKLIPLGIVTGRPRSDANDFLKRFKIESFFETVITLEDAPPKPSPEPILLAMNKLNISRAWFIGDTPDDINAARKANLLSIGYVAPQETSTMKQSLEDSGAAIILSTFEELQELLK